MKPQQNEETDRMPPAGVKSESGQPVGSAAGGSRRWLACVALFWTLSAAFFWQPLFQSGILVPTSPRSWQPWSGEDPASSPQAIASNPLMGDSLTLTCPWRLYNHQMLRSRELPFWNPHIFSGYPHLAALQSNALYPLTLLFDLLDPLAGIAWAMALHLALAGCFMFFFLRRLGLGLGAATLGGVLFELNGFFLVRMSAPSYIFTGIWAPLFFIGLLDLIQGGRWRSSWKIVLATCFAFLGGHPQIFVLLLLTGLAYALFLLWPQLRRPAGRRRAIGGFLLSGLAVGFGVGLTGLQLLPFLELMRETTRSPIDFTLYQKLALPVTALAQAIVPDFFGHPIDRNYWLPAAAALFDPAPGVERFWGLNYCGENLFTGVAPLVLALYAMFRVRFRETLFFGALAALSLLVVFGSTPVLRIVYELIPSFQYSRSDRIIYIYMLAVPVLAALGYSGATRQRAASHREWVGRGLLILPLLPTFLQLLFDAGTRAGYRELLALAPERLRPDAAIVGPQIFWAVAVAVLTVGSLYLLRRWPQSSGWVPILLLFFIVPPLFRFGWTFNPVQKAPLFPQSRVIERLLKETGGFLRIARFGGGFMPPNTAQLFGFFDVNGASAAALGHYARLIHGADADAIRKDKYFRAFRSDTALETRLLDLLNVELIFTVRRLPLPELADLPDGLKFRAYRNPDRLPRFFLVDQIEPYRTAEDGIRRLLSPGFEPGRVALVSSADGITLSEEGAVPTVGQEDSVDLIHYSAHDIELEVRAPDERLLVSSEVDYPGWEVYVDGSREEKVLVNTAFRGVVVPAGEHRISFRFVPKSFYLGLGVSLLSFVLYLMSLLWMQRLR